MTIRSLSTRGRVSAASTVFLAAAIAACGAPQEPERSTAAQGEGRSTQALVADTGAAAATVGDTQSEDASGVDAASAVVVQEVEPEPEVPASDDPDRDLLDAALAAAVDGDSARAERNLQQLVRHEEYGPYASYNLGVLAYARGERDQARRHFQTAIAAQPGFGPAMVALVRESLAAGKTAEARQLIETQRQASDDASGVRAAALFVDLAAGDPHAVIAASRGVLIDNPRNLDVYYALAMANLDLGRFESAEYILNQALRRDENRADIYYALGRVALERGRETDARGFFERAVQLNPHYPEANVDLASLQLRKLEYAQVVAILEPVVRHVPEFVEGWINYGSGLKGVGRVDEAKQAFETALALDPQNAQAAFNLGILYLDVSGFESLEQLPRMEEALNWFSKYRALAGTIAADDPVIAYEQFVRDEIKMQEDLARQAAEDAERARARAEREAAEREAGESGAGDSGDGWDDWGDDAGGSDDGWDDWGDEPAPAEPAPAAPAAPDDDGWDDWGDGASHDETPTATPVDPAPAAAVAAPAAPAEAPAEEAPAAPAPAAAAAPAAPAPQMIIVETEPAPAVEDPAPAPPAEPATVEIIEVVAPAPVEEAPAAPVAEPPAAPASTGSSHDDWGDDWDAW